MNETLRLSSHPFCVAMAEQRQRYGYSFQKLADRIGCISRSYMKDVESGRCNVTIEVGMMICQELDIPASLCLDYVADVLQIRARNKIQEDYQRWLDTVPNEVFSQMMKDDRLFQYHNKIRRDGYEDVTCSTMR